MITVANRIYVAREYAEAFEQDQSGFEFERPPEDARHRPLFASQLRVDDVPVSDPERDEERQHAEREHAETGQRPPEPSPLRQSDVRAQPGDRRERRGPPPRLCRGTGGHRHEQCTASRALTACGDANNVCVSSPGPEPLACRSLPSTSDSFSTRTSKTPRRDCWRR